MKLDVNTMETFYEMAREGAGLAADRLAPMIDLQTRVSVTRLHFTSQAAIADELDNSRNKIGISVSLVGDVEGRSLILFDEESANDVARMLVSDVPGDEREWLARSAIAEVGAIMNNGFVDGWADVLGTEIDVSPPEFITGVSADAFVDDPTDDDLAVAFRSRIEAVDEEIRFQHYLVPEHDTVVRLLEGEDNDRVIDSEKLSGFDQMAGNGAAKISENLEQMTGIDAEIEVWRIEFISLDAIPEGIATERLISVAFTFDGMLSGYLLFLFDRDSAVNLVESTLGSTPIGDLGALERDAIQELSNVMASGFLDGWANVLETTIDHSTPAYTYDMGAAVVDPLVVGLSERQEFAFVFDVRIQAAGTTFHLDIYAIPDEDDLINALETLDTGRVDESSITPEFAPAEAVPSSFEVEGLTKLDHS
ncbi:chemotaxis protein CheC [Halocatena marina]|uniref:Chemotaxis protein CheC n=1 Tax=Halocatena marina TaxID=2934937 RepID=A0ABD5YRJ8_9EURY|nr:chemotaxis protein CheC [Halocatena marina]